MTSLGVARSQLRKVIETHLQAYKDILDDQWLERKHEVDQKWAEILKVKSENNQKSTEIQKVKSENENVWSNLKYVDRRSVIKHSRAEQSAVHIADISPVKKAFQAMTINEKGEWTIKLREVQKHSNHLRCSKNSTNRQVNLTILA